MIANINICSMCDHCLYNKNYDYVYCDLQYDEVLNSVARTINWDEYEQWGSDIEEEIKSVLSKHHLLFVIYYIDREDFNEKFTLIDKCPSKLEQIVLNPIEKINHPETMRLFLILNKIINDKKLVEEIMSKFKNNDVDVKILKKIEFLKNIYCNIKNYFLKNNFTIDNDAGV